LWVYSNKNFEYFWPRTCSSEKHYSIAAQLEPIEIDMIEECHNINAVNCIVQRETIQWQEHIKTIFDNNINELAEYQKVSFKNLLLKFQDTFSKSSTVIGRTEMIEHTIDTGQALPVKQHPRRVPLSKIQEAEAEIEKMAEQGIIEPSTSPWCFPVVISRKKDSSIRFAIDVY
jgi:hypothetical protein